MVSKRLFPLKAQRLWVGEVRERELIASGERGERWDRIARVIGARQGGRVINTAFLTNRNSCRKFSLAIG